MICFISFVSWFHDSTFLTYSNWKWIVKTKVGNFGENAWTDYCANHPSMHTAQAFLKNGIPHQFWCLADNYPDLVCRMHIQIKLMGNFGFNCGVPWLAGTNGSEDITHSLLDCPFFKENIDSIWLNIKDRITETNPLNGTQICNFTSNHTHGKNYVILIG